MNIKKLVVVVLIIVMLVLTSCESAMDKAMNEIKEQFRTFDIVLDGEYSGVNIYILTDRDTDAEYIIVQTHQGIGITKK